MTHIVLLGDSIFDNKSYVGSGPDVIHQLRDAVPPGWSATLCAVDGHVTSDVNEQLARVPNDATHLAVSVGGNDALVQAGILLSGATSVADALNQLSNVITQFEKSYQQMLRAVLARELPTAVCTIYNPRFEDAFQQKVAIAALCLFNDCIVRAAIGAGIPLIDLRLVCSEYSDYANDIEPGVAGGAKIAKAITSLVSQHDFSARRTAVYV